MEFEFSNLEKFKENKEILKEEITSFFENEKFFDQAGELEDEEKARQGLACIDSKIESLKESLKENDKIIKIKNKIPEEEKIEFNKQEVEELLEMEEKMKKFREGSREGHEEDEDSGLDYEKYAELYKKYIKFFSSNQGGIFRKEYEFRKKLKDLINIEVEEASEEIKNRINTRMIDLDNIREKIEILYPNLLDENQAEKKEKSALDIKKEIYKKAGERSPEEIK